MDRIHELDWEPEEHGDERPSNFSDNRTFAEVVEARLGRRGLLKGALGAAITGLFSSTALATLGREAAAAAGPVIGFTPVPVSTADTVIVPPGYKVQVLIPWGTPIDGKAPAFSLDNSGADQARQVGMHHDGMHFFPIDGSSTDGLLVVNHEYVEPRFMHKSAIGKPLTSDDVPMGPDGLRDPDEVLKEINAHGVSIVRVARGDDGQWKVVADPRNRRITAATPMEIGGPVRGSDFVKTKYSPDGTRTRGTLNNCAHGVTPWNTYLTCEENWAGYFVNRDKVDQKPDQPREHARYGVPTDVSRYGWEKARGGADEFARFDASRKGASPIEDYRNEPNTFGWVVEIDPFRPNAVPVKRTALGRFAHEGVIFAPAVPGKPVVCYSGDDARFEYIYKFVSAKPYDPATASGALLDEGTLYVAKFNDDGTGEWLPLVFGQGPLTPANGFTSQADVLVNTRLAADKLGATKMDRPEWGAVDPGTGLVYFTLTNNSRRKAEQVNAANPRAGNEFGHIIRWREAGDDHAATRFTWDIFVLAGDTKDSKDKAGKPLAESAIFACPDGLWFDPDRRLWIQTDMSEDNLYKGKLAPFGSNQMLCANPDTGEIRRFLVGPPGQEITGVITTPDQRTMFVNVQHPGAHTSKEDFAAGKLGSHWPDGKGYPRSATLVITREDGGIIGT